MHTDQAVESTTAIYYIATRKADGQWIATRLPSTTASKPHTLCRVSAHSCCAVTPSINSLASELRAAVGVEQTRTLENKACSMSSMLGVYMLVSDPVLDLQVLSSGNLGPKLGR